LRSSMPGCRLPPTRTTGSPLWALPPELWECFKVDECNITTASGARICIPGRKARLLWVNPDVWRGPRSPGAAAKLLPQDRCCCCCSTGSMPAASVVPSHCAASCTAAAAAAAAAAAHLRSERAICSRALANACENVCEGEGGAAVLSKPVGEQRRPARPQQQARARSHAAPSRPAWPGCPPAPPRARPRPRRAC
jgi:hypothetical protein